MFAYKKAFIRENNPVLYVNQAPDSSLEVPEFSRSLMKRWQGVFRVTKSPAAEYAAF